MKVSVVIATYRRAGSLGRTLGTIAAQHRQPEEVIVIDQSPPHEREAIAANIANEARKGLNIRTIWSDKPSSTHARNLGLAASGGEWVIFSDDDVDWPPELTGNLIAKVDAMPGLVMAAARDTVASSQVQPCWRRIISALLLTNTFLPLRRGKVLACMQARYPRPVIGDAETEWAMGYWFAVDRRFVQGEGITFDEKLTRYAQAEDMLFSNRIYQAAVREGKRCVLSQGLAVTHLVSKEWREPDSFADLCDAWNRIYIAGQLRPGWRFFLSLIAIHVAAIHKILVRVFRRGSWVGPLRAHLIALRHLGDIRAGRFRGLYEKYEKPSGRGS
jgi:glycosyltransferase involved in cell wall biosynthesis